MGNLTTITFRNDSFHDFKDNPKQLSDGIIDAMNGTQLRKGRNYFHVGSSANPVVVQRTRHADDKTLYMHAGNTVVDVYDAKSEWAVDTFIQEMEYHLKRLKNIKKSL